MKEVDFKDRVPTYPNRVILRAVEGQNNTFDMERADAPLEVGTPLDKAMFNSIVHSRLTGRFYPLEVISELQTNEENIEYYKNIFTAEGVPSIWECGQKITVQTPDMPIYYISSNTFMGFECNMILLANKRYELMYNGTAFEGKEV